jgi:hypothetical protein
MRQAWARRLAILAAAAMTAVGISGPAVADPVSPALHRRECNLTAANRTLTDRYGVEVWQIKVGLWYKGDHCSIDKARLILQNDGNFVLYDEANRARWAANTVGRGGYAKFQVDGNLVVYHRDGRPAWASRTHGHPGSVLDVQEDGNLVIYVGPNTPNFWWQTNTDH